MPSELMDGGRGVSTSSHFYEDIGFSERQVGFCESTAMPYRQGMLLNGSKSVASSPLEKNSALGTQCMPETCLARSLKESVVGGEVTKNILKPSDRPIKPWSDLSRQPELYSLAAKRIDINRAQYESSLFSCSLSEILNRKIAPSIRELKSDGKDYTTPTTILGVNLSGNVLHPQPTNGLASQNEKELVESLEEIEAKTIGSLLPDEEDLFSGMTDDLGYSTNVDYGDDLEDFDLFSSGGGMELEGNTRLSARRKGSDFIQVVPNGSVVGEHPSRTLFVRNINSSVEDSELKSIFEQYGDIRTLYTACKHRGFVMISYYDLRAAQNARASLQNKLFRCRKLDIHYSIPKDNPLEKDVNQGILAVFNLDSSISNEELCQIYAIYGDIKEVSETPYKKNHKLIEFYDIRAAEIALRALNKIDIAGKQIKLEPSQYIPSFHPHSLPEYHDNFINRARVVSNGHSTEFNRGVFGSSGNGNFPPHVWSNSNSYQYQPPSPVMWSNSPLLASGVHAHHLQQISGFPRAPPYILNSGSPVNHHVGSAPAVNPSLWDRGRTFFGESPEASNFHLGSLRSVGSPLSAMEIASRNIYPRVGGTGQVSPMHGSFDYPNEHVKNLSHRRNEANSNNSDKKQYELNVDRIMCGEDTRTTLMIKNIPNKYTSKMLLAAIDEYCRGYYDFIYLPIDFKNKCNVGYAFINMVDPHKIIPFYQAFNGKKWEKFNSEKVAYLAYARIQGKAALVTHFQNSSLMNEDKRCRPILFHTAGPNAGDQEPFPMGSNIRSRPGKGRSSGNEDNNQGSLSTFGDGEDSCNGTDSSSGSVKNSD